MTPDLNTVSLEIVNKNVDVGDVDEEDGTIVSGIALGNNDVTVGKTENKKKWPPDTLREAAPTLAGSPLVTDHENDSQSVVGKVTKSAYKPSAGVVYEAVLFDDELARKVENGLLEVSIRGYHGDPEEMEKTEDGAAIIDRLVFDNLSIVPTGASPSNTLEVGEHAELESVMTNDLFENTEQLYEAKAGVSQDGYNPSEGDFVAWYDDSQEMDRFGKVVSVNSGELEVLPNDNNETEYVSAESVEPWFERGAENSKHGDTEKGLQRIVDKHNERVADGYSEITLDTVQEVYERGISSYTDDENMGKESWAMTRVSAFLQLLQENRVSEEYHEDDDLLPEEHPMYDADAPSGKASKIPRGASEEAEEMVRAQFNETFNSKKKAQNRSQELGIGRESHTVTIGDKTFYMPGESHAVFIDALRSEHTGAETTEQEGDTDWITDDSLSLYEKQCRDVGVENELLEPVAELDELDEIYAEWQDAVNMTADEMAEWSEHPCSNKASIRPSRVKSRNLNLFETDKSEWEDIEMDAAKRAVSFITRMRGQRPNDIEDGEDGCPSKWSISLLNWGYNPFESLPPEPEAELEVRMPDYRGLDAEGDWSGPDFKDFREPYNLDDEVTYAGLDAGMREAISQHFLYSADGWPPENYTDLKFPVVHPDGRLSLSGLRTAKQFVSRSTLSEDEQNMMKEVINDLAKREFGKEWTQSETTEQSVDIPQSDLQVLQSEAHSLSRRASASLQQMKEVYRRGRESYNMAPADEVADISPGEFALERVHQYSNLVEMGLPMDDDYTEDNELLPRNHPRSEPMDETELTQTKIAGFRSFSGTDSGEVEEQEETTTMTNEDTERVEELEAAVEELESRNDELLEEVQAVRAEYAEALSGDSPFDEDELVDKFTVEELREKYDETEEARLAGAGPAPEAGDAGEAELSNPDEEVEQRIEELEAQAENYEAMGWDAALAETETKIEELRN